MLPLRLSRFPSTQSHQELTMYLCVLVTNCLRFPRSKSPTFDSRSLYPSLFHVLPLFPGHPTSWGYNEPSTIQWPSYMTPGD